MSTMEKDRVTEDESASPEEQQPVAPRRSKKTRKTKKRDKSGSSGPLDQLPVGDVLGDGGPVGQVKDTVGGLTGGLLGGQDQQQQQGGGGGGKSDTLRLRLDLNLEVEIQLKARIHGDLELALLTG